MDIDFEKWLKKNDLFKYYNANPEQQADIYEDYQREKEHIEPKHIDEWVEWLCKNPELAEKHYPLLVQGLKKRIQESPSFVTANIIQKLPELFSTRKTEIKNLSGKYKEKRIKEQIALLNGVLNEWKYATEIEQEAIESLRPILSEQLEYWKNELRLRIKALFQFIEYIHSNIENFNQYNSLIEELEQLDIERKKLKPKHNYKDKQQYNKVQAKLESKFKTLQDNTANLIKAKARELNFCNFENEPNYSFNGIETEIRQLKDNFSNEDLAEIFKHKSQYIEYRSNTHGTFLSLQFFFNELDELAKSLFDYFKDTEQNEFVAFETETIPVNSITEMAEIISGKHKLNIEIDKNLSISEKLDYWKSIVDKHFNEPLTIQFGEYEFTFEQEKAKKKQLVKLFGTNYSLISPLLIPKHIYNEHFENALNEPEFTYWFLKHNAQTYFDFEIKMKRLPEKLKTPLSENFIKAELKKLTDFEQKAETFLHESKFDIYNDYSFTEYAKEIEYLRIKADYYKTHALQSVHAIGDRTVVLYAEHVYLKQFLENELNNGLPPQQNPEQKETELSKKVTKHFGFFNKNCPRKHKKILKDDDFNKLIDWTILYFENGFKVPEISKPIKVVNTNKTYVQLAFRYLFKELHKNSTYPETLFEFYQSVFNPYSEDKRSNFEAVKNNDEVKELMKIDY